MPGFTDPPQPQDEVAITVDDEGIDEDEVASTLSKDHMFIFVVDQSGSMSGQKMEITKRALELFLMSLPVGSRFDIVSFGTRHEFLSQGQEGMEYNEANKSKAMTYVQDMYANFGGTNIANPMTDIFSKFVKV